MVAGAQRVEFDGLDISPRPFDTAARLDMRAGSGEDASLALRSVADAAGAGQGSRVTLGTGAHPLRLANKEGVGGGLGAAKEGESFELLLSRMRAAGAQSLTLCHMDHGTKSRSAPMLSVGAPIDGSPSAPAEIRFIDRAPGTLQHDRDELRIHGSLLLGRARVLSLNSHLRFKPARGMPLRLLEQRAGAHGVLTLQRELSLGAGLLRSARSDVQLQAPREQDVRLGSAGGVASFTGGVALHAGRSVPNLVENTTGDPFSTTKNARFSTLWRLKTPNRNPDSCI